jgi:hypothetical protein
MKIRQHISGLSGILIALIASTSGASAQDDVVQFHSPSKNIYCIGVNSKTEGGSVDCEIVTRTNTKDAQPRPSDCDLEWGNRFAVYYTGEARMICAGDTLRDDNAKVLNYGEGLDRFGIHCTSSEQGIECINDDQHGFKIAKGRQEVY